MKETYAYIEYPEWFILKIPDNWRVREGAEGNTLWINDGENLQVKLHSYRKQAQVPIKTFVQDKMERYLNYCEIKASKISYFENGISAIIRSEGLAPSGPIQTWFVANETTFLLIEHPYQVEDQHETLQEFVEDIQFLQKKEPF